jgi:hypothetical protein
MEMFKTIMYIIFGGVQIHKISLIKNSTVQQEKKAYFISTRRTEEKGGLQFGMKIKRGVKKFVMISTLPVSGDE